jgi:hypothetical protein
MSTALRRSARLVANDTSSSPDSQPPSRRELARRRAAAMPPRQHFVVVEKEDSFDVMLSPMMGPFGVVEQDIDLRVDAIAHAAVHNQITHARSSVTSPAQLRALHSVENTILAKKQVLQRLTVAELKVKLNNYCMTTKGKKTDLVQRMLAFEIMFQNDS